MNLGGRIRAERIAQSLTQEELARAAGIKQQTLQIMETRDSQRSAYAPQLANALGVNLHWLLTGEGERHSAPNEPSAHNEFDSSALDAAIAAANNGNGNAEPVDLPPSEYVGVTKVTGAHLSAGGGEVLWEIDEVVGSHAFRVDYLLGRGLRADRCKVWSVRGDSMEPRYCSGDVVLIDMSDQTPVHGKVYALIGPEGLRIKQLRRTQSGWEMFSFNPDQVRYPPEPIIEDNYAIIGRVRWHGGNDD